MRALNLTFFMAAAFLGATLDLLTTWIGLALFNCYETRPYGFNPFIEYFVILGATFLIYKLAAYLGKASESKQIFQVCKVLNSLFITLPYYAAFHNVAVIWGLI